MKPEQDPRMKLMERIIAKNEEADRKYEREMQENFDAADEQRYNEEFEKENAEEERQAEDEANQVTPEEALEMFTAPADEGGFGDLLENPDKRQKIIDSLDLEVAAGAPNDDWRTYERVGNRFREREKQLKSGEIDPNAVSREDVMNQLAAQQHREMLVGNAYCEAEPEPEGPEETRRKIAQEYSDFDIEQIQETVKGVDEAHKKQFIERGYASNEYEIYRKAGEDAERQRYLRERNQD